MATFPEVFPIIFSPTDKSYDPKTLIEAESVYSTTSKSLSTSFEINFSPI